DSIVERRTFVASTLALLSTPLAAGAQPARVYRIGVLHEGGWYADVVNGLRDGLRELGLEESKQYVLQIHEVKGDLKAGPPASRSLEADKVDLIYTVTTSVTTAARQATRSVPIVFYAGGDPVEMGLVESLAKPGGRLTGLVSRARELTPKRLELLKEIIPALRRV